MASFPHGAYSRCYPIAQNVTPMSHILILKLKFKCILTHAYHAPPPPIDNVPYPAQPQGGDYREGQQNSFRTGRLVLVAGGTGHHWGGGRMTSGIHII